ncbi:MAG: MotA/TolQ/ExbB proton channel family protein [Pseudomonadota bacterium]
MYEFILKGGYLMWPILICSIASIAILLERIWTLRLSNVLPNKFISQVENLVDENKISEAHTLCTSNESAIARVLTAGFEVQTSSRDMIKERVEGSGRREAMRLERFLNILNAIAGVAPLIGLLGTVLGMIEVFSRIEATGSGNIKVISGGIYSALITTVAGLSVAIPTFLFARYLEGRIDGLVSNLEEVSLRIVDKFKKDK